MPEPHEAPSTGESEITPADGAANTPGPEDSAPTSQSPTSDMTAQLSARFKAGYGKGADKGRAEGQSQVLEVLGFGSLDEALEWKERIAEAAPKKPDAPGESKPSTEAPPTPDIKRTPEFRELMTQHRTTAKELEALRQEAETLRKRADEARLDKLRAAALARGVGDGGQLDAFTARFERLVSMDPEVGLEMVDAKGDPTGQPFDEWLQETLDGNPFFLAPARRKGSGSEVRPVQEQSTSGPDYRGFGVAPPKG